MLPGTTNCLDLNDTKYNKRMALCFKPDLIAEIKEVFHEFYKCRMGFIGDKFYQPVCSNYTKLFYNATSDQNEKVPTPTSSIVCYNYLFLLFSST